MNIEDYIKHRKDHLDIDNPPEELWNEIKKDWKPEKSFSWWKAAAVVFITTSLGLLLHNLSLQNQVEELATLGDISEEYKQIEDDYLQQINTLESNMEVNEVKNQEDFNWVFEELDALEDINELYRRDIGKINEEQLVGVLIDYYEKKIRLLKKLELEIKRTNKFKDNEETNTTNSINI